MMMKMTQVIATVCSVAMAAVLLVGCHSKGKNNSDDYHDNDMQRMDKHSSSKRNAGHGAYTDK
jgi:hypothetical protein